MVEKKIKITADTSEADKDMQDLLKRMEAIEDATKDIGDSAKKSQKDIKGMAKGFKGVGLAIKAMGIGLLLKAFAVLEELFMSNQKLVDAFSTAFNVLAIVFKDVTDVVLDNFPKVTKWIQEAFSLDGIKKFGKFLQDGIIERFNSMLEVLGFVGKAMAKFFTGDFKGALDEVKNAGKEMVDVITGVDGAYDKGKKLIGDMTDAVVKYGKETLVTAESMTELKNSALLLASVNAGLIEDYNVQIEAQRQIRDSDLTSIADRLKANKEVKRLLEEQSLVMKANADVIIASAQADKLKNDSIENQVALQDALNGKKAIEAQIMGQMSEYTSSQNGLINEQLAMKQALATNENERILNQLKFDAELLESEDAKLLKLIEINEKEKEMREIELQEKIDSYALDTQARIDAENELTMFLQENANEKVRIEKEAKAKTEADNEETKKKEADLDVAVSNMKVELADNVSNLVNQIAGEDSKVAKGVAVASATIKGIEGVQNAYTSAQASPITAVFPAYPIVQASLAGVFSALQIKSILSTDATGKSSGGGAKTSGASPPSFNLVEGTGTNQIAEGLEQQKEPIKAYVTSSDVSTGIELDRKIIQSASL